MTTGFTQETLEAISAGEPAWLKSQRLAAWKTYEKLPLPTKRDLEWQRFDIRALKLDKVSLPAGDPAIHERLSAVSADLARKGVIFCDMVTAVAKYGDLLKEYLGQSISPEEPAKFSALHSALWKNGAFLYVPANVRIEQPLEVAYEFSGRNTAGFPHTLVVVEPGAEATLVQKFVGGPPVGANGAPSVHASGTEVFVKEGGHLHYISEQNFSPNVYDFTLKRAHVARDAEIDWVLGMFGASFQRYDVQCVMEGEGGTSFMYAVGVLDHNQQFAQFTRQHHKTGNTTSDLLFKNVLRDSAVSNYAGVIKVEKNANGTNAYQANRNLVLNKEVRCDTRPILEIESNQLRCTHGATVGQLEEQQLFYLRSRGLTPELARDVLIEAFLDPVLARIQVDSVHKEFAKLVHDKVVRKG
ncbi:MAG TPA: Fe-S cluster assembly protein SufD [Verrucomicrobiae bacterium]|nr:Fe-S cluster assembly protein SufD [Verrucomicrobiae bacterium]